MIVGVYRFWCDRWVKYLFLIFSCLAIYPDLLLSLSFCYTSSWLDSLSKGRNGGHLTPNPFIDFTDLKARYGQEEASKAIQLEAHTAKALLEFVNPSRNHPSTSEGNIAQEIDLVAGGHVTVFVTNEEYVRAKEDFDAAKEAGVDVSDVDWISSEKMLEVCSTLIPWTCTPG